MILPLILEFPTFRFQLSTCFGCLRTVGDAGPYIWGLRRLRLHLILCRILYDELTLCVVRLSFCRCKSEVVRFAHSEVLLLRRKVKLSSPN